MIDKWDVLVEVVVTANVEIGESWTAVEPETVAVKTGNQRSCIIM